MALALSRGNSILFIGDSITDCGRRAGQVGPMGRGYPLLVSSRLAAKFPELELSFCNKGISGDRIRDVAARWKRDAVALRPSIVSILAGVNDTWRRFDSGEETSAGEFEAAFRSIIEATRRETSAALVLCEPFVLPCGLVTGVWREDLDPKIAVVRGLAREFGAALVPLDEIFTAAASKAPCEYWAEDGVHPTYAGHGLVAQAWLRHVLDIE
jgi:acyl-CoA thioesterase I